MKINVRKIFIIVFPLLVIVFVILYLSKYSYVKNNSLIELDRKIETYKLNDEKDYIAYFETIKESIKPTELKKYMKIDSKFVKTYKNSIRFNSNTNQYAIDVLLQYGYSNMIFNLINDDKITSYPITTNFKNKIRVFKHIINEFSATNYNIVDFSYKNRQFSVQRDWLPDDAYEKYTEEQIDFMLNYGAGSYNLDNYNYEFVLDKDGYLDDIIFKDITHLVVEGRDVRDE